MRTAATNILERDPRGVTRFVDKRALLTRWIWRYGGRWAGGRAVYPLL